MEVNFTHDELCLLQELLHDRCQDIQEKTIVLTEEDKKESVELKEKVDWYLRPRGN